MKELSPCRSCGSIQCRLVLDLGQQPLANRLLRPDELSTFEPRFPLRLQICTACWLLQIADDVPPADLFSEYLYFSSFSDTMLNHARQAAERYRADYSLGQGSFVIEIASNDGYLLRNFVTCGIPCLGIEPAENIARVAREHGVRTRTEFFGDALAERLVSEGQAADLVLGNNVFAHAPNPNDFVAGLQRVLKPGGHVILEFPYALDFLERCEFDTVYHEHVFYFTLTALQPLFHRHRLALTRIERLPIHGGSLRLFAARIGEHPVQESVDAALREEATAGIRSPEPYARFARRARDLREELRTLLGQLRAAGRRVAAYGASAKGSTLLNFLELAPGTIEFVVDRSPHKQGRYTPGTHLPIHPPEHLRAEQPDFTLLLTWNFADEILRQQQAYRDRGGRFIVPLPELQIV
jgi:SAM-dependent methyltransferase